MNNLLSLTRAAKLVGEHRAELQKKIQSGELPSYDGKVAVEHLLQCYPTVQLEDNVELKRVSLIKDKAFGKRVFERVLPDAEVLAVRITEMSKVLANSQAQLKRYDELIATLWDKFSALEAQADGRTQTLVSELKDWLKLQVAAAIEPGFHNPLVIKNKILSVLTAHATLLPTHQDFLVEGQDSLLEAAMRAGISVNYGCSGGNCGLCKARIVSGQVKKTRNHEFPLTEAEKSQGYVLLCSNTAVTDVTIEAEVTGSVQDIPYQQLSATLKSKSLLTEEVMSLHVQTPRTQRLRFLAGQHATIQVGRAFTAQLPIASCPCDDRNLVFHVHRQPGNLFSDYVFGALKAHDPIEIEGPMGEFVLHEKTSRSIYFIAFDGGFAPISSLIEHALSLKLAPLHLHWVASNQAYLYLPKLGQSWHDALDQFEFSSHLMDFDLRALRGSREEQLLAHLRAFADRHPECVDGDVYLAGPDAAVEAAEQFFLRLGLPKTRVFVDVVK